MANANDKQHGGTHYKQFKGLEPWDVITYWGLGYLDGTALKYIARWKHKNGIEDLRKAIHFLEKCIEVELDKGDDVPAAVKQYGGLAGSMDAAQGLTDLMGRLRCTAYVAGQDGNGFSPDDWVLSNPNALDFYHMKT